MSVAASPAASPAAVVVPLRVVEGDALIEFVRTCRNVRIPADVRPSTLTEDDLKGLRMMSAVVTPRRDSPADAISKVTYNDHECRYVNSVARILRFAREVKGADLDARAVQRQIAALGFEPPKPGKRKAPTAVGKKRASPEPNAAGGEETPTETHTYKATKKTTSTSAACQVPECVLRLGRLTHGSHHGEEDDAEGEGEGEGDRDGAASARRAKKLGRLTSALGLTCLFDVEGRPVKDALRRLTEDTTAIAAADAVKLRKMLMFYGEVLQHREEPAEAEGGQGM